MESAIGMAARAIALTEFNQVGKQYIMPDQIFY